MGKPKSKVYMAQMRILVDVNVEITARTLDEAVEKSKQLSWTDAIDILGEHNDSEYVVKGVYQAYDQMVLD